MAWRFEVYADVGSQYRWRCIAENGEKVGTSGESFYSQSDARQAAQNVKANANNSSWSYEIYADTAGYYRWRLRSSNYRTVASSGESFYSESNARQAADRFRLNAPGATGP
jgi:uncharacterized protein YegP (UPF0339 family)